MAKRVAILLSGGGSNMVSLVHAMAACNFGAKPVLVVSNNPTAGGLEKAKNMGIATAVANHRDFDDRHDFENRLTTILEKASPDVICLAGFMRVLTAGFVERWQGKILNIHPSLLPKYKGLHTHARALEAGDKIAGCTVHLVTPALDDGPILGQATVPVLPQDTPETLAAKVLIEEHKLYPAALRSFVMEKG